MSEDVAGNVREAFQGRRGKILIVGGGLAIAAYVWYTRRTGTPEPAPGDELGDATPVTGGRTPQTDPPVGNDSTGSTTPQRPTNNAAWISQGVDFLVGRAVSGSAAYSALTKALDGAQLTTQETAWVSQVIGALGSPPDGMPPLSSAPPTPPGGGGGTPPPGTGGGGSRPAGAHIHHVTTTRTTATVGWNAAKGSTSYTAYRSNAPGPVLSRSGMTGTSYTWTGLTPGRSYAFSVAGVNKAGRGALSNVVTVKTKN